MIRHLLHQIESSGSEAAPDDDSNLNENDGNDSGRDDENLNSGAESDYDSRQQMELESENDMQINDFVPPLQCTDQQKSIDSSRIDISRIERSSRSTMTMKQFPPMLL